MFSIHLLYAMEVQPFVSTKMSKQKVDPHFQMDCSHIKCSLHALLQSIILS